MRRAAPSAPKPCKPSRPGHPTSIRHAPRTGRCRVLGRIDLGPGERVWTFTPSQPWQAGPHRLAIDHRLEDLAGNRPGALFDRPADAADTAGGVTLDWAPEAATE